jgi:hypothetical protein
LRREFKRNQDAGLLRVDCTVTDGGDTKESSNEEIVCQYDYCYPTSFDEICGDCWDLLKRHIKTGEKRTMHHLHFLPKKEGVLPPKLK